MNEADILETTYEDSCIIERLTDIEDSNTNITIQDYKKVYDNPISCALNRWTSSHRRWRDGKCFN